MLLFPILSIYAYWNDCLQLFEIFFFWNQNLYIIHCGQHIFVHVDGYIYCRNWACLHFTMHLFEVYWNGYSDWNFMTASKIWKLLSRFILPYWEQATKREVCFTCWEQLKLSEGMWWMILVYWCRITNMTLYMFFSGQGFSVLICCSLSKTFRLLMLALIAWSVGFPFRLMLMLVNGDLIVKAKEMYFIDQIEGHWQRWLQWMKEI